MSDALCARLEQAERERDACLAVWWRLAETNSQDLDAFVEWVESLKARLEQAEKLDHRLLRQGTIEELRGSLLQESRYRRAAEERAERYGKALQSIAKLRLDELVTDCRAESNARQEMQTIARAALKEKP